jgi:hypothetical protein
MRDDVKEYCRQLIFEGFTLTYKDVNLCDLRGYLPHRLNHTREYQVSSNDWLENYHSLDEAMNVFTTLVDKRKNKTRRKGANH